MRKNKKIALSAIALSVLTVTSVASNAASQAKLNKAEKVTTVNQSTTLSFAQWQAQKKLQRNDYTDRLIITFKDKKQGKTVPPGLAKKIGLNLKHVKVLKNNSHVISLDKMHAVKDVEKFIEKLRKHPSVESIEPDYQRFLFSQNQPWGISKTQSDQLTDTDAANMTVCIIDSGYEQTNPDLNANNASGTNNSGTGNWYQNGGSHGTHVAGTIAGVNNSEGIVGILPSTNVNLHIVKVFNESGWGYSGDLSDAVDTCVNNGAKVINMSLGGSGSSNTEKNALQAAADTGVLLIAASGNDGNTTMSYPASYDSVMAVGALDSNNQHAEFSQYTSQVEISAPGEAILSTVAGDGRLGFVTVGAITYGNDSVVPQTHYIQSGGNYVVSNVNGSANGVLASCTISGSSYNCTNVNGNICLAERNDNQKGSNYPEINPAKACADAGASAVIVYSDSTRPGLQNPFLVDANTDVTVPTVSVSRVLGLQLMSQLGTDASLTVNGSQDYAYYNGTSMATPHVTGVAALVWSNNPNCTADDVRSALKNTAIDLDVAGRDDKTGFGLVQAKAASDALAASCGDTTSPPSTGNTLENGVAKANLSSSTELSFTMEVPAGATELNFDMAGGTGDADLYVKFGSAPTSSSYDCRPYKGGNAESCPIASVQAGTYFVKVVAYSTFSGVSLTGSFTEPSTGGGVTGGSASVTDISVARRAWTYYTIDVPAGMATLDFAMSGGSGDADMYIRRGSQPTSATYDCRPYESGNTESCSFTNPAADTWHIGVYGYSAASGVNLDVTYNP
ncbi:S8 family serine peptidase [Colwellia psychrerythraea]|uniref:Peptidase S8 and S53 subtilisin kexin sedolisin n=1 Tax=Colwellia psychrerythraea TaxID=28229 RepID=A0A099KW92_COLPS|nr:S8 family serine peptidase [Colwellia psychrerythraea]KGJ94851.1 peptidase S8 and S53 subtilisin kexin sedolisin [Colwellia psychrerythraea]